MAKYHQLVSCCSWVHRHHDIFDITASAMARQTLLSAWN